MINADSVRGWMVGGLLLIQVPLSLTGPFRDTSYLAWAPFHEHATYRIVADVQGKSLSPDEIRRRYGVHWYFYDPHTGRDWQLNRMSHVLGTIERVERRIPPAQQAQVVVTYRINGREELRWVWP